LHKSSSHNSSEQNPIGKKKKNRKDDKGKGGGDSSEGEKKIGQRGHAAGLPACRGGYDLYRECHEEHRMEEYTLT